MLPRSPIIRHCDLVRKQAPCPRCGTMSHRHSRRTRCLAEIGVGARTFLNVAYSMHSCGVCRKHFAVDMTHLAPAGARYTWRVMRTALDVQGRRGWAFEKVSGYMRMRYHVDVPPTTIYEWHLKEMEKPCRRKMKTA